MADLKNDMLFMRVFATISWDIHWGAQLTFVLKIAAVCLSRESICSGKYHPTNQAENE